jgi:hypothetical protein
MIDIQEKSPTHLDNDTNDSDYFLVKRFTIFTDILKNDQETIKILPNAEIQLTIEVNKMDKNVSVVEIKLCSIKNDLPMEISLHMENGTKYANFTKTLGTTNFFVKAFFRDSTPQTRTPRMYSRFQLDLKLPYDFNDTTMSKLFSEGELSDVEIICDGQTFQCHKLILAMKSDVFKAMLYTNKCTDSLTGTVQVDDINAKTMKTLINYMYQNKVTLEEVTDLDVLNAAKKYNVVDLIAKCEKYIVLNLSMKNVLDVLAVGKSLPTLKIFEKAMEFFRQNAGRKNVLECPRWLKLEAQDKNEIFESCLNMTKCTEEEFNCEIEEFNCELNSSNSSNSSNCEI